jgi:gamma-glutamyl-gamma-aminobutyrate hydrolase PuuD
MPLRQKIIQIIPLSSKFFSSQKDEKTLLDECIMEINKLNIQSIIDKNRIKEILNICIGMQNDHNKIFTTKFISNIEELNTNKNPNEIFGYVFPPPLQKFLTFLYISFQSHKDIFIPRSNNNINIKNLDIILFKKWLMKNLSLSEKDYIYIIKESIITKIFIDSKNMILFDEKSKISGNFYYSVKSSKHSLCIGLLWNYEDEGITTPIVSRVIRQFCHRPKLIEQFFKNINRMRLEIEIKSLSLRSSREKIPFIQLLIGEDCSGFIEINKIKNYSYNEIEQCDGIIIPGGMDVESYVYSNVYQLCNPYNDIRRTLTELFIINKCVTKGLPLLGICRGCQIINVYFGGNLINVEGENYHGKISDIKVNLNDSRFKIFNEEYRHPAISLHNQRIDILGKGLKITSLSSTNETVTKSIETEAGALILGLQFHPEYYISKRKNYEFLVSNRKIFDYFFNYCSVYNKKSTYLSELLKKINIIEK